MLHSLTLHKRVGSSGAFSNRPRPLGHDEYPDTPQDAAKPDRIDIQDPQREFGSPHPTVIAADGDSTPGHLIG
jgi:hypothetical protein